MGPFSSRSLLRELILSGMTRIGTTALEQVGEIEWTIIVIVVETENTLLPLIRRCETMRGAANGALIVEERTIKIIAR